MEKRMSEGDYQMLMMSMDFIYHNQNIPNTQIPNHLLRFWAIPNFTEKPKYEMKSVQIMVFLYILRLYKFDDKQLDEYLNTIQFSQLFFSFQIVIAATLYCREAKLKAEPFPIFHLHEYKLPDLKDTEEMIRIYEVITDKIVIRKERP